MDKSFYIFIISCCCVHAAIKIKELDGPDSIEIGSTDEIILDCNYEADRETDIELKWFYNGDTEIVYQWIPEGKGPGSAMGILKGHLDVEYIASNDTNMKYRALKFKDIIPELSGNYTCKVSSFNSEDSGTKQLIIYSPAQSGLDMSLIPDERLVICTVQGVFPKPEIDLYISGENGTKIDLEEDPIVDEDDDGHYNVTIAHYFPEYTNLSDTIKFVCDLSIPGTDYFLSNSVEYTEVQYVDNPEEHYLKLNNTFNSSEDLTMAKESTGTTHSIKVYTSTFLLILLLLISQ